MQGKWQSTPKLWRLRGKAADGMVVTLGRYETAEEAQAELARITALGGYRNLTIEPIEPKPEVLS